MLLNVKSPQVFSLLFLLCCCLNSAVCVRDSLVCHTAVEFTRFTVLSLKTRTGAMVLPQPQLPDTNVTGSSSSDPTSVCRDQTSLRSLWSSSVVRLTPLDQTVCLLDRAACLRIMARAGTVVLFWSGSSADRQLVQTVLSGSSEPDKVTLFLVTLPSQRPAVHALATQLDTNVGTDVWMAVVQQSTVTLSEIYTKCATCDLTVHPMARWSPSGLQVLDKRTRQERRGDLGGITLRAVGVKVFPIYTAVETINGVVRPIGGVFFDLATALANDLNFRLNITLLEGYAYGKRRPDGTYTGMVGELQAGRADMTVSEVSFTNAREQVIDYTQTVSVISRRVYVHVPTVLDGWLARYSRGISVGMVALSLLSVIVLSVTQRLCEVLLIRSQRRGRLEERKAMEEWKNRENGQGRMEVEERREDGREMTLGDTFWIMFGMMLLQGADAQEMPSPLSARVTFLSCLLLGLLVSTAYSATLISFLTSAGTPPLPFADLQGLTKLPDWRAGWKEGDLLENVLDWCALRNNPTPDCRTLAAVWKGHVLPDRRNNLVQTYEDGFKKVAEGNYAFIAPNEAADYQLSKMAPEVACRVLKLEVEYAPGGIALGLQNNSPYKELFDQSLQRLYEAGVTEKLYRSILRQREACGPQEASAATLLQTLGAFLLLVGGLLLSCLLLLAEWLVSRIRRRRRSSRRAISVPDSIVELRQPCTIHLHIKTSY